MRIKKFVIVNVILSIFLISSLYGLSWLYINYVNDRTVKFMEYNKLPNNSIDIVSLGSSHGKYGLKLWEKNQMNLALESQGMYYNLKLLEKYQSKIKEGAKIIIPISIFSFYEPNYESQEIKNDNYKNYINILDKNEIGTSLKTSEYYIQKKFSVLYPPNRLKETLAIIIKWIKYRNIYKNKMFYLADYKGEQFKSDAKGHAKGHITLSNKNSNKYGITYTREILEICKKNKWDCIYIVIPCHKFYVEELEKIERNIFIQRIYNNLDEVDKKYKILDYIRDERFYNNEEYFLNADHLNEKGAEYFTKILLSDIVEILKEDEKRTL